ncbi:MAG TPA: complex I NDUFA9 subunit family protein [Terriglobales bacterium]|nr:complex I NDUFA9 subunit family protein [Terriglobales bacterium]
MKIFLSGGTGFVGSHLLRRLLRDGHLVRALVRDPRLLAQLSSEIGQLETVQGDVLAPLPADALAGCDAVIHLVGIIYEQKGSSFDSVHSVGTEHVVTAAQQAGVQRFVQMSALGARAGDASRYHTSKFAAEEIVRKSSIPHVVLRPSLIFGPGSGFVEQMTALMRRVPFVRPVAGTGQYRFAPIYVDDVVECFAQSLTSTAATNQTVNLVGPEELTLEEIGDEIALCLGVRKSALHIPMPLMKSAATLFSFLPVRPPVTRDQLRMLEEGSTADPEPMKRIFHIQPIGFRRGLRQYLCATRESSAAN